MQKNVYSVEEYFKLGTFVVPYYQRGYKWSLLKNGAGKTHLEQLLVDLEAAYKHAPEQDYHLQGVTVQKSDEGLVLVDGQQRTTSLFLLLLFFEKTEITHKNGKSRLKYKIRVVVEKWIENKVINPDWQLDQVETSQDIAAFDKAWRIIRDNVSKDESFIKYLQEKVKLIYVVLNTDPEKVFSMMNKDKAVMTQTDLVKAKLLSEASRQAFADLDTNEDGTHEWQINHLRSHFAREWDSWRKWWEARETEAYFGSAIPSFDSKPKEPGMARLLRLYYSLRRTEDACESPKDLTVKNLFQEYTELIQDSDKARGNTRIEAVETFEGLRETQKILEEWYDDPVIYNWLGLMKFGSNEDLNSKSVEELVREYKSDRSPAPFEKWYRKSSLPKNQENVSEQLKGKAYKENYELAAQQLLRINVLMLNGFYLKFDFCMYEPKWNKDQRSLEHIFPQSKFSDSGTVTANEGNSIGNLALIPKGLNSSLNDKDFAQKKPLVMGAFLENKSRKMALFLHSLQLFSGNDWGKDQIESNRDEFITEFENFYAKDGE